MKERLDRNKARLTEADERKIWQAITDERTKKARPWWGGFRIPAFAGAAAVAALLVVTYLGQSPGDRSALTEMAAPRAQRMNDLLEYAAPAPETTKTRAVLPDEETGDIDGAGLSPRPTEKEDKPATKPETEGKAGSKKAEPKREAFDPKREAEGEEASPG
ncbi:MAG: hypothetical protein ABIK65_13890, partial [Candidatus Eisenbacteria bacterium]